jgi:microcystin-dependent protein
MAEPFIGEIRPWALNFAPRGWAFCNGQLLPLSQNTSLFAVIGTYYGGDGKTTLGLPNLQGRAPMNLGHGPGLTNRNIGEVLGTPDVTLTEAQLPAHTHTLTAQNLDANSAAPAGQFLANSNQEGPRGRIPFSTYAPLAAQTPMAPPAIGSTGGSQSHENMQPYLAINMCIALVGIFPSRS